MTQSPPESALKFELDPLVEVGRLPKHIAIVMDGNGRWAKRIGHPRTDGHRQGSDTVRTVTRTCRRLGISALTLYAFSAQNWDRPPAEVDALMALLREFLLSERSEILDNNIRLRSIGSIERLPRSVRDVLDPLVTDSANNTGMVLTLALSYGGREEIVDAVRRIAAGVADGKLAPKDISDALFEQHLPSMEVGPVDLLIRTGGEQRISNFLLWSSAYAELYFSQTLWPEYEARDLYEAIAAFQRRERRFGRVLEATIEQAPAGAAAPTIEA
jgi:undecaprenyl diphosphate synthase